MFESRVTMFYQLLRELMMYVNQRLQIVVHFDLTDERSLSDPTLEDKCRLVLHQAWQEPGIIDDFIRDRGSHLSPRAREEVRSWKHAFFSVFTVLGERDGRLLMVFDDTVFAVSEVAGELSGAVRPLTVIETALLPFAGDIVSQYPVRILSSAGDAALPDDDALDAALAKRPIVATAQEFMRVADELRQGIREEELDYMLNGSELDDVPGAGFHRGALAGLEEDERERLAQQEASRTFEMVTDLKRAARARYLKTPVEHTLRPALGRLNKEALTEVARRLDLHGYSRLRKAELLDVIARTIEDPENDHVLPRLVVTSYDSDLAVAKELLAAGGEKEYSADEVITVREPLTFAYVEGDVLKAFVPEELRRKRLKELVEVASYDRGRADELAEILDALTFLYGVVEFSEAYYQYCRWAKDPLDIDAFGQIASGNAEPGITGVWTLNGTEYVVHGVLSEQHMLQLAMSDARLELARTWVREYERTGKMPGNMSEGMPAFEPDSPEVQDLGNRIQRLYQANLRNNESYIAELVDKHSRMEPKPVEKRLIELGCLEYACSLPAALALRDYLDAMVPDGANDYFFAERAVEDIVHAMVETGTIGGAFDVLRGYGYEEDAPYANKLVRLTNNLYNSLPSWENNGWSPREYTEKITGRKLFYAPDGSVLKPGRNDPCPCGSGKKYKKCCGR